jgi:hypothetical protein
MDSGMDSTHQQQGSSHCVCKVVLISVEVQQLACCLQMAHNVAPRKPPFRWLATCLPWQLEIVMAVASKV